MEDTTTSKLISVLKAAFEISVDHVELSKIDVFEIEKTARQQSIIYLAIVGIKKLGYTDLLTDSMKAYIPKAAYDYVQRVDSLRIVSQAMESGKIGYLPLKGAVLCELYPDPSMRSSSDIDVLVPEEALDEAIRCIEAETSFKCYTRAHHDAQFVNDRMHLELHFSLHSNIPRMDSVLDRVWDYAVVEDGSYKFHLTEAYQVFYITAHAAKHFIKEGGIGIRPLLDLWLLRTRTCFEEDDVRKLCDEAGILGFYETCCELLSAWFENKEYSDVTKMFEKIVLSGGVFGSEHLRIMAQDRQKSGNNYVLSRVFRSKADIKEMFPVCEKHPALVPVYQVVRWTHLIKPSKRRAAKKEWKQARELNQAEVEQYDELLKRMGL